MSACFGLHVGRTNSCVAVCKDSKSDVVANDAGDRVTPSIVSFSSEEIAVGLPAKQGLFRNMSNSVVKCKELLCWNGEESELTKLQSTSVCPVIVKNKKLLYEVEVDEKKKFFSPEDILVHIYKKLYDIAIHHSNAVDESMKAVVSVPLSFTSEQRQAVWKAAEKARFNILQVISEPAAALLAYGIGQANKHETLCCLVYRCGGATLDVSVVNVRGGMYSVVSSLHRKQGGDKFTALVANYLADEFQNKWKLDPRESKRSMFKLMGAAEECKHVLSTLNTAHCFVESLHEGVDLSANVSRARIDMLITQLFPEYIGPISEALTQAGLTASNVHKVIVCGGTAKMPRLQQAIQEALPNSELLSNLTADEVIAVGCSNQAAVIGEPWDTICQHRQVAVPSISKSISVRCGDEDESQTTMVFSAQTPLSSRFSLPVPLGKKHNVANLDVFEETELVAKLTLNNLPEAPSVAANFHLSSDGSLHVTLTEKITGVTTAATIGTTILA
nr:Hsp70-14 [Daphnia magna]